MNKWRVVIIILLNSLLLACASQFRESDLLKTVVKGDENFSVKIRAFRQEAFIGSNGVDYQIQTRNSADTDWKEVMSVHHDDGIELNDNNIILVSSSVAFAYISNRYAITFDKGENWKQFQLSNQDPSCMINKVKLEINGNGQMTLICNGKEKELITTDYGMEFGK